MLATALTPHNARSVSSQAGFSLVEVIISIGIIATVFGGVLGMLPVGMQVFRKAIDTNVGTQIVQRIINDAKQTDYATLVDGSHTNLKRYFDDQGDEVEAAASRNAIYTTQTTVSYPTALPAGASGTVSTGNLATLVVKLAHNPSHVEDPFANRNIETSTYFAYIARNMSK